MSKYIDIGANLASKQLKNNLDEILKSSFNEGNIDKIIITGSNLNSSAASQEIVKKYQNYNLYSTVGIHPHDAKDFNNEYIPKIKELLKNNKVVAVGECGLDFNRNFSKKEEQIKCFEEHIKLSLEAKKPLFLHERDAVSDFLQVLDKHKSSDLKAVVHCFTGNKKTVQEYVNRGFYVGITGWICDDRRNKDLLEAVKYVPIDKLMIETDSPYLAPIKAKHNEPKYISHIAEKMAQALGADIDMLTTQLYDNTVKFFSL